jgi:beta-phosphoglucomutase
MHPRAVLFDFDGVIADTENVHIVAWQRTLDRMGWELTDEAAAVAAEVDDRQFLFDLFAERKILRADHDGWLRLKQDFTESMLADAPSVYPGVVPLVEALREKGARLGVVTSTCRRNVEIVLEAAGLTGAFGAIVAKEDASRPKPDPIGYTLACIQLICGPDDVVALEDSPTGLAAARKAKIKCVALGHRRPKGDWCARRRYLPDLSSTPDALKALGF